MNATRETKEYSFENCCYIVSRNFGENSINELLKEKLTSEKSNRIIEQTRKRWYNDFEVKYAAI